MFLRKAMVNQKDWSDVGFGSLEFQYNKDGEVHLYNETVFHVVRWK